MSMPWILTVPWSGGPRPPSMCRSVLLPQPLGPMMATNSPAATVSDTSRIASRGGRLTR